MAPCRPVIESSVSQVEIRDFEDFSDDPGTEKLAVEEERLRDLLVIQLDTET
jgi:hypothetical protein